MTHDEFVGQVQSRARLGSRGNADAAIRATLETLAERLAPGISENLAAQLPPEISRHLRSDRAVEFERMSLDDFFHRVRPDTTPPSVAITAPSAGAGVSGPITVSAIASDNVSVAGVQFKLDGQPLGAEDTTAPYSTDWNTASASDGSHDLTAVARDAAGNNTASATVTVTVDNPTGSGPLAGHWKLDDGSGSTTAADSSGNGATGMLINNPAWTTGQVGGALRFAGTNRVSIPNQPSWNTVSSQYTVAFWVKVDQIRDYAGAVTVGNLGTRTLEIMTTGNRRNARINTTGGPHGWGCDATSSTLGYLMTPNSAFHHVALVLDAAASRCYVYSDGVLVATDEYVDGTTSFGTQSLNIGGFADANRLPSVIDDVRLYNAALTPAEVQALAEAGGGR